MRKRTGKKIFSAIAACLLAVTGNFPAMAAEIKKVRLRLTAEDFDESGRPEAEFQTDSEAYEVSGIEKNEEDIYEVELTALEGNEFAVIRTEIHVDKFVLHVSIKVIPLILIFHVALFLAIFITDHAQQIPVTVIREVTFDILTNPLAVYILVGVRQPREAVVGEFIPVLRAVAGRVSLVLPLPGGDISRIGVSERHVEQLAAFRGQPASDVVIRLFSDRRRPIAQTPQQQAVLARRTRSRQRPARRRSPVSSRATTARDRRR